jgi:prevent-host-death family protein
MASYSIAEARKRLPELVDEALDGEPATITRRGRDVAVVLSLADYERLKRGKRTFREAYAAYRAEFPEGVLDEDDPPLGPEFWNSLRDRSPGREFKFGD